MAELLGRVVVMANDLVDDKAQELLAKRRVEARRIRERSESSDLDGFTIRVGRGKADFGLMLADALGDLESFREQVHEGSVDVVDAVPAFSKYLVVVHAKAW